MSTKHHHDQLEKLTPLQKAVLALKQTQARLDKIERRHDEPISILGIGCRLPGGIDSPSSFWRLLCEGRDAVTRVSSSRWPMIDRLNSESPLGVDIGKGGFIADYDLFDHRFFGMTESESEETDPQQRLLLEVTWEALEDGGLVPEQLRGSRCGVFLGVATTDYGINLACGSGEYGPSLGPGTALCMAANRISYQFDWRGPSLTLDTACSSSLLCLHLACRSLRDGECDMAVVGGSNLLLSPFGSRNLAKAGFFSKSGRIRAFDERADGYVRSDGIVILVLKRQSDLHLDAVRPYALVCSTVVNQDGRSNGLTAPNRRSQEELLLSACNSAGIKPEEVDYVETQGTGTPMGDAVEAGALSAVFCANRELGAPLLIGSVKTNLGHTETASGVTSIIKVALAMNHRMIPPSIHYRQPNPAIPFDQWNLKFVTELMAWPQKKNQRLAGVSAFGFGGTNVHALLHGFADDSGDPNTRKGSNVGLLVISARSENALDQLAVSFLSFLTDNNYHWSDICYSAAVHRQHHEWRLTIQADNVHTAASKLSHYINGEQDHQVTARCCNPSQGVRLAFFFGGDPDNVVDWTNRLHSYGPTFAKAFADCNTSLSNWLSNLSDSDLDTVSEKVHSQFNLLVGYIAFFHGWSQIGIHPRWLGGAGIGVLAAAICGGVLKLESALKFLSDKGIELDLSGNDIPNVPLALQGQIWRGRSELRLSILESMPGPTYRALMNCSPQAVLDVDRPYLSFLDVITRDEVALHPKSNNFAELLSGTHLLGAQIAWARVMNGKFLRIPTYPWQHQRFMLVGSLPSVHAAIAPTQATTFISDAILNDRTERVRPDLYTPFVAPHTSLEHAIAQAWVDVLEVRPIGLHDNFMELGGDSLRAMMLLSRLQNALKKSVSAELMLQAVTVATQAEILRQYYPAEVEKTFPGEIKFQPECGMVPKLNQHDDLGLVTVGSADAIDDPYFLPVPVSSEERKHEDILHAEKLLSQMDELSDNDVDKLLREELKIPRG